MRFALAPSGLALNIPRPVSGQGPAAQVHPASPVAAAPAVPSGAAVASGAMEAQVADAVNKLSAWSGTLARLEQRVTALEQRPSGAGQQALEAAINELRAGKARQDAAIMALIDGISKL